MEIDESNRQNQNAVISIQQSREPDSKVTVARSEHWQKQEWPSFSAHDGMQIDRKEHIPKAESSIRESLEPDSNATAQGTEDGWKSDRERHSTDEGIQAMVAERICDVTPDRSQRRNFRAERTTPTIHTKLRGKTCVTGRDTKHQSVVRSWPYLILSSSIDWTPKPRNLQVPVGPEEGAPLMRACGN
jgi:hypothetical protein